MIIHVRVSSMAEPAVFRRSSFVLARQMQPRPVPFLVSFGKGRRERATAIGGVALTEAHAHVAWAVATCREPLNGVDITLPIRGDVKHAISGYRQVVESLLTLHEASQVCLRAACR